MSLSKEEHIRNVLVAASAAIPLAGGPLSVILDKYLPEELGKRKENLLESISTDLKKNINDIDETLLSSPEYLTTFIKVFQKSLNEHRDEKLIAFRNILINEAISNSSKFDEVTLYIRLVDDLTIDQIRILHLIYKNELDGHCSEGSKNNIYEAMFKKWPEIDKHYLTACFTELLRFFIVTSAKDTIKEQNVNSHSLTSFGMRFVEYMFTPNDLKVL